MIGRRITNILKYILIFAVLGVLIFPIYWMLIASVSENRYLLSLPPHFFPKSIQFESMQKILTTKKYLIYFQNSFIVASGTVIISIVLSVLAGYSFSRYRFKGRNVLLTSILSVQMFPVVALLISLYTFYYSWGLTNTYPGLILADVTFALPLSITLMRSFFDTIPRSIDESAKIDGAGRLQTLFRILLPLTLPGLVAVGIYTFLKAWDDFLCSLIIMQRENMKTLPIGLAQSFMGEYVHDYSGMMAFAIIGALPIVLLFIFFQKQMISGLTAGAVKG
jgi:multiple sugar transport system permease protein